MELARYTSDALSSVQSSLRAYFLHLFLLFREVVCHCLRLPFESVNLKLFAVDVSLNLVRFLFPLARLFDLSLDVAEVLLLPSDRSFHWRDLCRWLFQLRDLVLSVPDVDLLA